MATDFTYGNKTIDSNGGFKPSGKNTPIDVRTRVNTFADIASIPVPYIGMIITVLEDETNSNKMTDYKVLSLKANASGLANSVVDQVQRYTDYLGVNGQGVDINNFATKEELDLKADKTELHSHINKTVLDGITSTNVDNWNNKVDKVEGKTLTTNDYTNEEKQTVASLKATVGDTSSGLVKDVTDLKTNGISQDNINTAVEKYLQDNPIQNNPFIGININDFPKIEGETNDSPRIQRAFNSLPSKTDNPTGYYEGITVFFPNGVYEINSTVTGTNVSILGDARTIFKATGTADYMFDITFDGDLGFAHVQSGALIYQYRHFYIEKCTFNGNDLMSGVKHTSGHNVALRDCMFLNCKKYGYNVTSGSKYYIDNCTARCTTSANLSNYGFYMNGSDSHFVDCTVADYTTGFYIGGQGAHRCERCHHWLTHSDRMESSIAFDIQSSGNTFLDCYLDTVKYGFKIGANADELIFTNCSGFVNTYYSMSSPIYYYNNNSNLTTFICGGRFASNGTFWGGSKPSTVKCIGVFGKPSDIFDTYLNGSGGTTDSNVYETGYISDNGILTQKDGNYTTKSFVSVNSNSNYTLTCSDATSIKVALYDYMYNYISRTYSLTNTLTFDTGEGKFIKISFVTEYPDAAFSNYLLNLNSSSTTIKTTAISLDKNSLTFTSGSSQTLIATVTPSDSTQSVTWSTDDNNIATVDNGIITPKTNGSCIITATSGDYSDTCNVTVNLPTLSSITATYNQGDKIVYTNTSLNSLKNDLLVTAEYSDSTTANVSDYELSGTLSIGISTITVTYQGKTTTFTVNVTEYIPSGETYFDPAINIAKQYYKLDISTGDYTSESNSTSCTDYINIPSGDNIIVFEFSDTPSSISVCEYNDGGFVIGNTLSSIASENLNFFVGNKLYYKKNTDSTKIKFSIYNSNSETIYNNTSITLFDYDLSLIPLDSTISAGYINDSGILTTSTGNYLIDSYASVKPSTTYRIIDFTRKLNNKRFSEYDSSKTFIKRSYSTTTYEFTTQSTTNYVTIGGVFIDGYVLTTANYNIILIEV